MLRSSSVHRLAAAVLACAGLLGCSRETTAQAGAPAGERALPATESAPSQCPAPSRRVAVKVDAGSVLRERIPAGIFGFNVPRREFRDGFFRDQAVRPEVVEWLKPFAGALYRYPAGTPANWFEWRQAIGAARSRTTQYDNYGQTQPVEFGYPEFLGMISKVGGRALLTVNLSGPYERPQDEKTAAAEVLGLMRWMQSKDGAGCVSGAACPVAYWEFGNELDWPPFNWTAKQYAGRINATVATVGQVFPDVQWIAHGKTAPWDPASERFKGFDNELAALTDKRVEGVATHAYYDGYSVPDVKAHLDSLLDAWAKTHAHAWAVVTEHARWPSQPLIGRWEDNWAEATNLDGALSTADFQLAVIADPRVVGANLHTISTEGPWQLFRWQKQGDRVYPSPVYWALRTLREGMQDKLVRIEPALVPGRGYHAGYDARLVATASAQGSSVMGVNRSGQALELVIDWQGYVPRTTQAELRWITGAKDANNTDEAPDRVRMLSRQVELPAGRTRSTWCIPERAVFSIVER
ncbi:MAG: hypothetical protein EPO12_09250 [Aquabacterium sp.]|jgi:alpha-N-arabinofuranosidase|nr:MAG: hypothetical protein EPO12_09250 [Aquabacterium sp.]